MNFHVPMTVDTFQVAPPEKIDKDDLKALSTIKAWKFNVAILLDAGLIALSIFISEFYWFNPAVYIIAIFIIGGRMHGLAILMHEATHSLAYTSKQMNLYVGEILAWYIGSTMSGYRVNHLSHHKKLNSQDDPDWVRNQNIFYVYPKTRKANGLYALLLLSSPVYFPFIFILNRDFSRYKYNKMIDVYRTLFYVLIIGASIISGFWQEVLLYWLVPAMTVFFFLLSYRGMAEHHGNMEYTHVYNSTRHVDANWFEKFFLAPHNVEYHLAHHLYPQVPYYNLPKLHRLLMQKAEYREKAHITHGYLDGFISELTY